MRAPSTPAPSRPTRATRSASASPGISKATLERAEALAAVPGRAKRQVAIVEALAEAGGIMDKPDLLHHQGSSGGASLKKLVERGLVVEGTREKRDPLSAAKALGMIDGGVARVELRILD